MRRIVLTEDAHESPMPVDELSQAHTHGAVIAYHSNARIAVLVQQNRCPGEHFLWGFRYLDRLYKHQDALFFTGRSISEACNSCLTTNVPVAENVDSPRTLYRFNSAHEFMAWGAELTKGTAYPIEE